MTYQVLSVNKLIKNQELAEFPQLEELINWYQANSLNEVSLKNLRRQFPAWSTITKDLENWVKLNLIERYDGRYRLKIALVSALRYQELSQAAKVAGLNLAQQIVTDMPVTEEIEWLVPLVIDLIVRQAEGIVAVAEASTPKLKLYQQETEEYLFIEVAEKNNLGVAAYFENPKTTLLAQETRQLIGDVDPNYFLTMSGNVMETVIVGERLRRFKDNIFVRTLLTYDYLSLTDKQPQVNCAVGSISQSELTSLKEQLREIILSDSTGEQLNSSEEQLFVSLKLSEVLRLRGACQYFIKVTA